MVLQLSDGGKKCMNLFDFRVNFPGKYQQFFSITFRSVGG